MARAFVSASLRTYSEGDSFADTLSSTSAAETVNFQPVRDRSWRRRGELDARMSRGFSVTEKESNIPPSQPSPISKCNNRGRGAWYNARNCLVMEVDVDVLNERILRDGKNLGGGILKVDSFVNHQVDPLLMDGCGREFARRFAN